MSRGKPFVMLHACGIETIGLKNAHLVLEVGAGSTSLYPTESTTDHKGCSASNQGDEPNNPKETHARILVFDSG